MERAILHCDLNNFYASVECRDFPHLKGKAIAVCGRQEERHGIVLAKNELAKKYGVSTGEPIFQAKKKCPYLVITPPHYDRYLYFSNLAKEIYLSFTCLLYTSISRFTHNVMVNYLALHKQMNLPAH